MDSIKEEVKVEELIKKFEEMANKGRLLTGENVTQEDLLSQITGTIIKVAMNN